ncbi:hypothetical protein QE364_001208 [Nocardioides zeae]|uniref:Uncharacterized protein n=1 Tax=Nocardioides zeae TaxID=1457234 RepID=A0ACC6IFH8_9ACTN|nr:hypothetical protein [Nocardioides zeae]MDR6176496.1 hypothetical protein [Nocardioides zeae]MDR6209508.1 hypothetical protein [Nocardioides zeae]
MVPLEPYKNPDPRCAAAFFVDTPDIYVIVDGRPDLYPVLESRLYAPNVRVLVISSYKWQRFAMASGLGDRGDFASGMIDVPHLAGRPARRVPGVPRLRGLANNVPPSDAASNNTQVPPPHRPAGVRASMPRRLERVVETDVGQGRFAAKLVLNHWSHLDEPESLLRWQFEGPDRRYNPGSARIPMSRARDLRDGAAAAWAFATDRSSSLRDRTVRTEFESRGYVFGVSAGRDRQVRIFPGSDHSWRIALTSEADLAEFVWTLSEAIRALPGLLEFE